MRSQAEYNTCKAIAIYLRLQYPNTVFHFDLAGLNLSRAQAGMAKVIQYGKGWPDLFILAPRLNKNNGVFYNGLFIEVKQDGVKLTAARKTDNYGYPMHATPHIADQAEMIDMLNKRGYYACFACGFDSAKDVIDWYLNL